MPFARYLDNQSPGHRTYSETRVSPLSREHPTRPIHTPARQPRLGKPQVPLQSIRARGIARAHSSRLTRIRDPREPQTASVSNNLPCDKFTAGEAETEKRCISTDRQGIQDRIRNKKLTRTKLISPKKTPTMMQALTEAIKRSGQTTKSSAYQKILLSVQIRRSGFQIVRAARARRYYQKKYI